MRIRVAECNKKEDDIMKSIRKTASTALALLLICTAGFPAVATMAVKEVAVPPMSVSTFFVSTGSETGTGTPVSVSAEDLPDMNFSKLQISPPLLHRVDAWRKREDHCNGDKQGQQDHINRSHGRFPTLQRPYL